MEAGGQLHTLARLSWGLSQVPTSKRLLSIVAKSKIPTPLPVIETRLISPQTTTSLTELSDLLLI